MAPSANPVHAGNFTSPGHASQRDELRNTVEGVQRTVLETSILGVQPCWQQALDDRPQPAHAHQPDDHQDDQAEPDLHQDQYFGRDGSSE
jgi:hypothetical protein